MVLFYWRYSLLRLKMTATHPSPARIPANGAGVAPDGVGCVIGFTVGTSDVGVGVGVAVGVGVGVSVSQVEEP